MAFYLTMFEKNRRFQCLGVRQTNGKITAGQIEKETAPNLRSFL